MARRRLCKTEQEAASSAKAQISTWAGAACWPSCLLSVLPNQSSRPGERAAAPRWGACSAKALNSGGAHPPGELEPAAKVAEKARPCDLDFAHGDLVDGVRYCAAAVVRAAGGLVAITAMPSSLATTTQVLLWLRRPWGRSQTRCGGAARKKTHWQPGHHGTQPRRAVAGARPRHSHCAHQTHRTGLRCPPSRRRPRAKPCERSAASEALRALRSAAPWPRKQAWRDQVAKQVGLLFCASLPSSRLQQVADHAVTPTILPWNNAFRM